MKRKFTFIILILLLTTSAVKAAEYSSTSWHDAIICNPCHESILPQSISTEIFDGCSCHYPPGNPVWKTEVDIQGIKSIHGIQPCIKCHFSSMGSLTEDNIHRVHSNTDCEKCHGNVDIIRPDLLDCFSCHESEIHGVHNDLEGLCVICHGEFGEETVLNFQSANIDITDNISMLYEDKNRKIPTIIEVLGALLQVIKI